MKNLITLLFLNLFLFSIVNAQDKPPELIELKWWSIHYFKDGKPVDHFLYSTKKLKSEFEISPKGMLAFEKYEKKRKTFRIVYGVNLASFVTTFLIDSNDGDFGLPDRESRTMKKVFGYTSTGLSISLIHFGLNARKALKKSIEVRNYDTLID